MSFGFSIGDFISVLQLAENVRQKWVDAPMEYASLRAEVRNVENILKTLVELVEQVPISDQQKKDFADAVAHCNNILHEADEIVNKYSSPQDAKGTLRGRVRRSWKRLKADPDDVRHLRGQLTAIVTQLGAIQNNIEIDLVQEVSEDIDELRISDGERKRAEIADWFAPSSFAEQHSDLLALRHAGTAVWFLQSQQYIDWRDGTNQTLFCPGIPGSGKTIIVATVINDLRQHFSQQKDVIVAYFYCNFRREQSLGQILAILVRQLFQELTQTPKSVDELYQNHKDRKTRPSTEELKAVFQQLVGNYTKVFLLVDALDECVSIDGTRNKLLNELFNTQKQPKLTSGVNILCTSRFIPEITSRFENALQLEIVAQEEDIEIYLDGRMSDMGSGVRKNKSLQQEIKAKITNAVDGMFLLARLHFESLQDKLTPRAVQKALEHLPKGSEALDGAYEEAMSRINQQLQGFRQIARKVIAWIVFAKRELAIEELQEAVAIETGMQDIDHDNDLIDADEMISFCAGLVIVDQESQIVRLVHYTTQEFFERKKDEWLPGGETLVAWDCINYLCMKALEDVATARIYSVLQAYKLLPYVGENWGFHASLLNDIDEYVQIVLKDKKKVFLAGKLITARYESNSLRALRGRWGPPPEDKLSELHICAYFNDTKAAQFMIAAGSDINHTSVLKATPFSWAARNGRIAMVKFLLSQPGIDVNLGRSLKHAAGNGYTEIVELILAQPDVDPNIGEPLFDACMHGHTDAVKLLLAHPKTNPYLGGALSWAAKRGFKDIVELFLAQPNIDINRHEPLSGVAVDGHTDIVELLLAQPGIDPNRGEPLSWAVINGHIDIVKLFLAQPGIDVNLGNPLSEAIQRGYEEIAELLRAQPGIDIGAVMGAADSVTSNETNSEDEAELVSASS